MDRSFLSDANVVAASRNFVCMRLATYENAEEAKFLKSLVRTRSGELENTVFAILSPDGRRTLATPGRGPNHAFRTSNQMAAAMNRIAEQYRDQAKPTSSSLPNIEGFELALNVASCDVLPLIVTVGDQNTELLRRLEESAWSDEFAGQFVFANVDDGSSLKSLTGARDDAKILVVQPGQFGLVGRVMAQFNDMDLDDLAVGLRRVVRSFPRKAKDHRSHTQQGVRLGIEWESKIPTTDPMANQAKARFRGR